MPPKKTAKRPAKKPSIQERQRRVPIGGPKTKLEVPAGAVPPGYVGRWVNDTPGRQQRFEQAGYVYAKKENVPQVGDPDISRGEGLDSRVRALVGSTPTGEPLYAHLMLQKKDWYQEDQAAKEADIQEVEDSMRAGVDEQGAPGVGGRALSNTPISIKHGK